MRWLGRGPRNSKVIRSKPGWWAVLTSTSNGMVGAWVAVDELAASAGVAARISATAAAAAAASIERTRMGDPPIELLRPSPGHDHYPLALSRHDHGAASIWSRGNRPACSAPGAQAGVTRRETSTQASSLAAA